MESLAMDDFDEPSVLEYARLQGIARNHQQLNPLNLLAQIRDSKHGKSLFSTDSTSQLLGFETPDFADLTSTFPSRNEKLVLDKDGVKFLTSVLQEVTSLQVKPDQRAEDTISLKLKYKPRDDLKIDVPLLSAERQDTLKTLSKRADLVEILNEIIPDMADRERASIDEGLEFPDYFWELPSILDRDPSTEKLEAPEGTGRVLLEALTYLDEKRHRKDVEEFFASSILDMASSSQLPIPPLYIESKEQHERNFISDSLRTDTDTGYDNEAVTETVATPGLLEEDNTSVGDENFYIESNVQFQPTIIRDTRSSYTDTGLVNEVVFGDAVTPGLSGEEDCQPIGGPLPYVESEEQLGRNSPLDFHHSGDTNTGHAEEAVAEGFVAPGLPEEDYQAAGDASLYFEIEERLKHNTILESHLDRDTDTDLNTTVIEYALTPGRVEEHFPYVGDVVTNKRAASPLSINEPEEVADISPRSKTALSQVTNPSVPFGGSLGTLSAFMQTRCHKIKRRKLDHESRYFSSTPKSSKKTRPVKADTPEKPTNSTKLPSSPVATHAIQSLNLYPKYHSQESNKQLLLILSTQLLRSNSTLVRSLEETSSSRSVRLIFRDYQGAKSSLSTTIEEADLIVSPTTGIILANFHETTQKYLPGQGPPGIESPLQARIVGTVPRYETIYVLVRSPLETSTKTLSSIRELIEYCMSLNHECDIKVLLITTDHVLEWILSIAAKHTIDSDLAPPLNASEDRTSVSMFHDDQTQWEVFLRSAGLNPFAAQSVLAMLKTSPAQSGPQSRCSEDVNQKSALSRFVEMPYQMRRHMFQQLVGQRVLSRVNKALEMDWQVDWAVDLT